MSECLEVKKSVTMNVPVAHNDTIAANNLSEGYREGRPEALAEIIPEPASQQADGVGRNFSDARRLQVDGQQSEGGAEALSAGDRFTLRKGGAKSGAAGVRNAWHCTASCTDL